MEYSELAVKAKEAKSAAELSALARENGILLNDEDAAELFASMHSSGEVSDDELDAVAGGGCSTKVNGESYTVVTADLPCFTKRYYPNFTQQTGDDCIGPREVTDHAALRKLWALFSMSYNVVHNDYHRCGWCKWLGFKNGTGYCTVEHKK